MPDSCLSGRQVFRPPAGEAGYLLVICNDLGGGKGLLFPWIIISWKFDAFMSVFLQVALGRAKIGRSVLAVWLCALGGG